MITYLKSFYPKVNPSVFYNDVDCFSQNEDNFDLIIFNFYKTKLTVEEVIFPSSLSPSPTNPFNTLLIISKAMKHLNKIVTIDFRNAKYQGETYNPSNPKQSINNNYQPNGFGIMLDQNYTWVAGHWLNGHMIGCQDGRHCVAVFGDSDKMYGFYGAYQKKTNGFGTKTNNVTVYEGDGYAIYMRDRIVVLDLKECKQKYSHTLIKFALSQASSAIPPPASFGVSMKNKPSEQKQNILKVKYISQQQYDSQRQHLAFLQQMIQMPNLSINYSEFQAYIRNSTDFKDNLSVHPPISSVHPQTPTSMSTSANPLSARSHQSSLSSELTICLKSIQDSITLKFSKKLGNRLTKISYNSSLHLATHKQQDQLCKKYQYYQNYTTKLIEGFLASQSINIQPKCYVQYEYLYNSLNKLNSFAKDYSIASEQQEEDQNVNQERRSTELFGRSDQEVHRQCVKNMQQYYKRSLNFTNKFINLSDIYKQRAEFKSIFKLAYKQFEEHVNMNNPKYQQILETKNKRNKYHNICSDVLICEGKTKTKQKEYEYQASIDEIRRQIAKVEEIGRSRLLSKSKVSQSNSIKHNGKEIEISKWRENKTNKSRPGQNASGSNKVRRNTSKSKIQINNYINNSNNKYEQSLGKKSSTKIKSNKIINTPNSNTAHQEIHSNQRNLSNLNISNISNIPPRIRTNTLTTKDRTLTPIDDRIFQFGNKYEEDQANQYDNEEEEEKYQSYRKQNESNNGNLPNKSIRPNNIKVAHTPKHKGSQQDMRIQNRPRNNTSIHKRVKYQPLPQFQFQPEEQQQNSSCQQTPSEEQEQKPQYYPQQYELQALTLHYEHIKEQMKHNKNYPQEKYNYEPVYEEEILRNYNTNKTIKNSTKDKYKNIKEDNNYSPIRNPHNKMSAKSIEKSPNKKTNASIRQPYAGNSPYLEFNDTLSKTGSKIASTYKNMQKIRNPKCIK